MKRCIFVALLIMILNCATSIAWAAGPEDSKGPPASKSASPSANELKGALALNVSLSDTTCPGERHAAFLAPLIGLLIDTGVSTLANYLKGLGQDQTVSYVGTLNTAMWRFPLPSEPQGEGVYPRVTCVVLHSEADDDRAGIDMKVAISYKSMVIHNVISTSGGSEKTAPGIVAIANIASLALTKPSRKDRDFQVSLEFAFPTLQGATATIVLPPFTVKNKKWPSAFQDSKAVLVPSTNWDKVNDDFEKSGVGLVSMTAQIIETDKGKGGAIYSALADNQKSIADLLKGLAGAKTGGTPTAGGGKK
jgi:hypothetical protein